MCFPSSLPAVNVYRYAPAASIEINTGVSVSFGIGADDPYGLDFSEWYIDSTYMTRHEMTGYYDEDTWSRTFSSPGTLDVFAYVYNVDGKSDFTWWTVDVAEPDPDLTVISTAGPASAYPGDDITV
ncbi:MAG: hypothetical protein LJE70_01015 [Chromatiaceae bacterium]|nr:hypothetical protein [Chromatiaceae bacterium]